MAYSPHRVQKDAHTTFLSGKHERGTIFWGRRVGKTLFSIWHGTMAAVLKQGNYWFVFDTKQHAKEVLWDKMLNTIPKELIAKTDATDLTITFKHLKGPVWLPGLGWQAVIHDPKQLPSKLILTGSDFAERDKGGEANGIVFDEYQDQERGQWQATYEPFLATTHGWAIFMGTAMGYNHWYDMLEDAKQSEKWFYSEATWKDNPLIEKSWIEDSRAEAARRGELAIWEREYELKFMSSEGAVYPMFDRQVHIRKPDDVPQDLTLYACWDFGWAEGHPMAWNLVGIDKQGKWWVIDEIHGTYIDINQMIEMIRMKTTGMKVVATVADSEDPHNIELARSKGISVVPAPKRQKAIPTGISLLGTKLRPKIQLAGVPEPDFYVTQNCRNTIMQFEQYRYREHVEGKPQNDNPIKDKDDHPDALRYLALFLKYGLTERRKPLKSGIKTNQYGIVAN